MLETTQSTVDRLKKREWRAQRDAFMTSAKFVIESLHSLSVDFTRLLDGEVSEKTWKKFNRGDVYAFTRRLISLGDKLPMEKIRAKYADDADFRTYVQRFIRQFEEVYHQARENDHGALLESTFVSSDLGRLYEILCQASGKEPVMVHDRTVH